MLRPGCCWPRRGQRRADRCQAPAPCGRRPRRPAPPGTRRSPTRHGWPRLRRLWGASRARARSGQADRPSVRALRRRPSALPSGRGARRRPDPRRTQRAAGRYPGLLPVFVASANAAQSSPVHHDGERQRRNGDLLISSADRTVPRRVWAVIALCDGVSTRSTASGQDASCSRRSAAGISPKNWARLRTRSQPAARAARACSGSV